MSFLKSQVLNLEPFLIHRCPGFFESLICQVEWFLMCSDLVFCTEAWQAKHHLISKNIEACLS